MTASDNSSGVPTRSGKPAKNPEYTLTRLLGSKITFVASIILFRIALDTSYILFVSEIFSYMGFVLDVASIKYVESWILMLVCMAFCSRHLRKPSDLFILLLLLTVVVPLLSMYGLADQPRTTLYIVLAGYVAVSLSRSGRPFRIPTIKGGWKFALLLSGIFVIMVTSWLFASGGLGNLNFDPRLVYDFRFESRELIAVGPMAYFNLWTFNVFGPLLLVYALYKRNGMIIIAIFILYILWFGISAKKTVLLEPFVVVAVYYLFRKNRNLSVVPLALMAVIWSALCVFLFYGDWYIAGIAVRRFFYSAASNTFYYFEFFGGNELIYWSNTLLNPFMEYPYDASPGRVIGFSRSGSYNYNVNNTFLAGGFMHAGIFGVMLYAFIAGMLLKVLDSVQFDRVTGWMVIGTSIFAMRALLLQNDLTTALSSHGVLVALGMLLLAFGRVRRTPMRRRIPARFLSISDSIE